MMQYESFGMSEVIVSLLSEFLCFVALVVCVVFPPLLSSCEMSVL